MAEPQVPEGEKQQPEKPKKKRRDSGGGISMPILIGAIVGVIVLIFAAVILGGFVASKLFMPQSAADAAKQKVEKKEEKKKDPFAEGGEESFEKPENIELVNTGRITTNPKNSTQFVVTNIDLMLLKNPETVTAEDLKPEGMEMKRLLALTKGTVNQVLGSMTVDELQARRDSLPVIFKESLKKFLNQGDKFRVKQVILEEFIIQ